MYLFFDVNGTLKEQITISPPIVGNSGVDKIYVYWEDVENKNITGAWCKYKKADGTYTQDYFYFDNIEITTIPYDQNRDLKFFKYNQNYKFYVFNVPDVVLSPTEDLETYSVLFSCWFEVDGTEESTPVMEEDKIKAMSLVAFGVDPSTATISQDFNINIAQWNELVKMITSIGDFDVDDVVTLSTNQDIDGNKNFTGDVTRNNYDLLDTNALKPTILTPVVCGALSQVAGGTATVLSEGGVGTYTVTVVPSYTIVAGISSGTITNINQETGIISFITATQSVTITWHYENSVDTRIGFKFYIGTDYNGIYVFTHSYLMMAIPVYELVDGRTYKFTGVGLQDAEGSVMNMVHNMKRNGEYLEIWSGNSNYPMIAGRIGTLAKIKLYN